MPRLPVVGIDTEWGPILNEFLAVEHEPDGTLSSVVRPTGEAQADSTATDVAEVVADLNALLAKLRDAGLLEP